MSKPVGTMWNSEYNKTLLNSVAEEYEVMFESEHRSTLEKQVHTASSGAIQVDSHNAKIEFDEAASTSKASNMMDFFPFLTQQKGAKYKMGACVDSDDYDSELERDDLNEKLEKIGEERVKKLQQFELYQKQVEEHGLLPRNDLERRQRADAAKRMKHLEDRRIQITKMKEVKEKNLKKKNQILLEKYIMNESVPS